jgi:hypothetical protein
MSIKITTQSFEWPDRNNYGQPTKNRVEVDVATTITHDTVVLNAYVIPPDATWNTLYNIELSMTHEEALSLAEAITRATQS